MTLVHYDSLLHTGTCSLECPFRCWDDKNVFNRFISTLMLVFMTVRWSRSKVVQRYPSTQPTHPQHLGVSVPNCSKPTNTDLTQPEKTTLHLPSKISGNPGQLPGNLSQLLSNPGQLSSNPGQIFGKFLVLLGTFGGFWELLGTFGNFWVLLGLLGTFGYFSRWLWLP